ncbi:hypothetical protein GW835_00395 [archaeon]|nr:hypothetical protein [archaeon]NCP79015.1 hypothetical protein [archaeon]NCP97602.1 hypothetical protein [archaeon]NCQ06782.1 hypothetical protein [archaeon]NCQ50578.1 hypothetical protein [archaeon]
MFVTVSRKSNLLEKRFSKYLTKYLPGMNYLPRGKTPLLKFFKQALYLGHRYFLIVSSIKGNILLSVYALREDSYFLEREYLIEVIDLRHLKSFSYISSVNSSFNDLKKVFYFLEKKYLSLKSNFGVFQTSEENVFNFLENEEYLGFKFKIVKVSNFD